MSQQYDQGLWIQPCLKPSLPQMRFCLREQEQGELWLIQRISYGIIPEHTSGKASDGQMLPAAKTETSAQNGSNNKEQGFLIQTEVPVGWTLGLVSPPAQ